MMESAGMMKLPTEWKKNLFQTTNQELWCYLKQPALTLPHMTHMLTQTLRLTSGEMIIVWLIFYKP